MYQNLSIRLYVKENKEIFEIIDATEKTLISRFSFPLGKSLIDFYYSDFKSFRTLMGEAEPILRHIRDNDFPTYRIDTPTSSELKESVNQHRIERGFNEYFIKLANNAQELPDIHIYYYIFKKYIFDLLNDVEVNKKRVRNIKFLPRAYSYVEDHKGLIQFIFDECLNTIIEKGIPLVDRISHFYNNDKYSEVKYNFREFQFDLPNSKYSYFPEKEYSHSDFANNEFMLCPEVCVESFKDVFNFLTVQLFGNNVLFNTCKNCGMYFVMDGHKSVEYCDREFENTGKTCREIRSTNKFLNRKKTDPIFKAYTKAYNTKNARIRNGKTTRDEFKVWSVNARIMRDKAYDDEITYEYLVSWLGTDLGFEAELELY